ncbi:hypothetical protein [Trueperella sp. LYQ143]|uniref:hypothetical protein n=1 Tax=unclassified Trueperella TaxID=2630174 RepID=UPI003983CE43
MTPKETLFASLLIILLAVCTITQLDGAPQIMAGTGILLAAIAILIATIKGHHK